MSNKAKAELFYGYLQPLEDKEAYNNDKNTATPWSAMRSKEAHGCVGEKFGDPGDIGFFLAIKESLRSGELRTLRSLGERDFQVKPAWKEQLKQAVAAFKLDVTNLQPDWYIVLSSF